VGESFELGLIDELRTRLVSTNRPIRDRWGQSTG
jgi:hypothetical protein